MQGPNGSADQFPIDFVMFALLVLGVVALQVYRYRHVSTSRERQQTKWVIFGCAVATLGFVVNFTLEHILFSDQMVQSPAFDTLITSTLSFGFLLLIPNYRGHMLQCLWQLPHPRILRMRLATVHLVTLHRSTEHFQSQPRQHHVAMQMSESLSG